MRARRPDLIVIGAGVAGLMAALTAAKCGRKVTLLEQNRQCAKKLWLLGRGRGEIARPQADHTCFAGRDSRFVQDALREFDADFCARFFAGLDIELVADVETGELRPERGGKALVEALGDAVVGAGVEIVNGARVEAIRAAKAFEVATGEGDTLRAKKVVLATGGLHAPQLADGRSGHEIARALGHTLEGAVTSQVGLRVVEHWPGRLPGLWMDCATTLLIEGRKAATTRGLVLFTRNSLTGPGVFGVSREVDAAIAARRQVELCVNFFPAQSAEQVERWFAETLGANARMEVRYALDRMLPLRLAVELLRLSDIKPEVRVRVLGLSERQRLFRQLTAARLSVASTLGWRAALSTRGGVSVREVDPRTFESRIAPGLYIVGEMLAVEGESLALNRHFALASGMVAGAAAARK